MRRLCLGRHVKGLGPNDLDGGLVFLQDPLPVGSRGTPGECSQTAVLAARELGLFDPS
jgi:hypothetical protein